MNLSASDDPSSNDAVWKLTKKSTGRHIRSLCQRCNNQTGSWYGSDYGEFAKAAAEFSVPPDCSGWFTFHGRLIAVAKQALACICSTSGHGVAERCPIIRTLIRQNKLRCGSPPFKLWMYLLANPGGHQTGVCAVMNLPRGGSRVVAEFSHWPIGWVLSWGDSAIDRLTDVTHWLDHDYCRPRTSSIRVSRLYSLTGYALDFRTPEQVLRDRAGDQ